MKKNKRVFSDDLIIHKRVITCNENSWCCLPLQILEIVLNHILYKFIGIVTFIDTIIKFQISYHGNFSSFISSHYFEY